MKLKKGQFVYLTKTLISLSGVLVPKDTRGLVVRVLKNNTVLLEIKGVRCNFHINDVALKSSTNERTVVISAEEYAELFDTLQARIEDVKNNREMFEDRGRSMIRLLNNLINKFDAEIELPKQKP